MVTRIASTDTQIHTTTIDTHNIVYQTTGSPENPPLLMVHGWGSFKGVWRQTIPALQDDYFCISVDLLGFGDSDKPHDGDYSIIAQAERCSKLMNQLGYDRFTLIGHSMGGQIALCMASITVPERIIKLVDVAGVVTANLSDDINREAYPSIKRAWLFPWLYYLGALLVKTRFYAGIQYKTWFHDRDGLPFADWQIDREMNMRREVSVSMYEAGQAIRGLDLTPHLSKITAPTLVIFGKQDNVVYVSDGHLADQHIPNSQLVLIHQCGHFPMYEQTEQYLIALREFLL